LPIGGHSFLLISTVARSDPTRQGSHDVGSNAGAEVISIREKKLVNAYIVKSGMFRFSFMLDCCQPGSIPDPHLMAALLDLVRF
jgi:hypothetical protein